MGNLTNVKCDEPTTPCDCCNNPRICLKIEGYSDGMIQFDGGILCSSLVDPSEIWLGTFSGTLLSNGTSGQGELWCYNLYYASDSNGNVNDILLCANGYFITVSGSRLYITHDPTNNRWILLLKAFGSGHPGEIIWQGFKNDTPNSPEGIYLYDNGFQSSLTSITIIKVPCP